MKKSQPPKTYQAFTRTYPKLEQAWELLSEAGQDGPLTAREQRLVKLSVAVGALREGAIRSNVRKGLDAGLEPAGVRQAIALAASTVGLPATVAVFSWTQELLGGPARPRRRR